MMWNLLLCLMFKPKLRVLFLFFVQSGAAAWTAPVVAANGDESTQPQLHHAQVRPSSPTPKAPAARVSYKGAAPSPQPAGATVDDSGGTNSRPPNVTRPSASARRPHTGWGRGTDLSLIKASSVETLGGEDVAGGGRAGALGWAEHGPAKWGTPGA
jgi:hypothetical protein